MFHTQAFWLRTLRLNPLKPFGSRCCVVQALGFRVVPFIATTTKSPTTTTTAGRKQAEKHRSALACRLRSTAPRCPQVPFRRQALHRHLATPTAPLHPSATSWWRQ